MAKESEVPASRGGGTGPGLDSLGLKARIGTHRPFPQPTYRAASA